MFSIEGGRSCLYQWDINQRLRVDHPEVTEVHFSNTHTQPALICEVYEEDGARYANIPNILLQQPLSLLAHGCCGECVHAELIIRVVARAKPADYVYTETELLSFEKLMHRAEEAVQVAEASVAQATAGAERAEAAARELEGSVEQVAQNAEAIGKLSEEIGTIVDIFSANEWKKFDWISNEYIDNKTGEVLSYEKWHRTDYIDISTAESPLTFRVDGHIDTGLYNAFYDANKQFISSFKVNDDTLSVIVPDGTVYMRLSCANYGTAELFAKNLSLGTAKNRLGVDALETKVDALLKNEQSPDVQIYTATETIPDYYFAAADNPQSFEDALPYLESRIRSIPDGKHTVFLTDQHTEGNAGNANKIIQYVRNALGNPFVINGGDYYDADDNRYIAMRKLAKEIDAGYAAYGERFLPVLGNHETNAGDVWREAENEKVLTFSELSKIMYHKISKNVVFCNYDEKIEGLDITDNEKAELKQYFRNNYHIDDVTNGVRYVVFNTGSPQTSSLVAEMFGLDSLDEMNLALDWFDSVLKSTPAGYDIVLCGHEPTFYENNRPFYLSHWMFYKMLALYKNKRKESFNLYDFGNDALTAWIGGTSYGVDYRDVPDVGAVVVLGGHWHRDMYAKYEYSVQTGGGLDVVNTEYHVDYSALEIPIVFAQCDAYGRLEPEWGHTPHSMTKGTVTEQCFDVVTITEDNRVVFTRFGAGVDRVLHIDG